MLYFICKQKNANFSATDGNVDNHGETEKIIIKVKGLTFADRLGTLVFEIRVVPFYIFSRKESKKWKK